MIAVLSLFVSPSCSKDDDVVGGSSLVGTKWTVTKLGTKYVLEFTSKTECQSYEADVNNNYTNNLHTATYTYDGNTVKFQEKKLFFMYPILNTCDYWYFKDATVSGNVMILNTQHHYVVVNIKEGYVDDQDKGPESYNKMKKKK